MYTILVADDKEVECEHHIEGDEPLHGTKLGQLMRCPCIATIFSKFLTIPIFSKIYAF